MSHSASWSDDRVQTLSRLWLDGLSASQIARRLGDVTRNAVIGKVHRLGLGGRAQPTRPRLGAAVRLPGRGRKASAKRLEAPSPPRIVTPARCEEPGLIRSMTALGAHSCKWPIDDPKSADFSFCGRLANGVYCTSHQAMAHRPGTAWSPERDPVVRRAMAAG